MENQLSYLTSSYDYRESSVHLWEVDSAGEVIYSNHDFIPFIFVDALEGEKTEFTNLNGRKVKKKEFPNYRDYKDYVSKYKELDSTIQIYENNFSPRELQFIVDRYGHIPVKDRITNIPRIHIFDIETDSSKGFPKPEDATAEVQSIAVYDTFDEIYYVYGRKEFDLASLIRRLKKNKTYADVKDLISKMKYIRCMSEESLLISAFNKMKQAWIYSGWNIENYDIPYLFNRCINLGNRKVSEAFNDLSPVDKVRTVVNTQGQVKKGISGKTYFRNYIPGKLIIDYMVFYKKFSYKRQSSFALDFVSLNEFKKGKIKLYDDRGYQLSLAKMYETKFEEFILYNARDCEMIKLFNDKYQIFEFALFISTQCNIPAEKVINMSNVIDGALLFYLRQSNQVAPGLPYNHSTFYPGGYVKDSQIGIYDWVVDFDITSSYPSHQICLNISPENLLGQVKTKSGLPIEDPLELMTKLRKLDNDEDLFLVTGEYSKSLKVKDFNKLFRTKSIAVAGDGRVYDQTFPGIMPRFLKEAFQWRMVLKKEMIRADNELTQTTDEKKIQELEIEKKKFSSQQLFAKMILNSVYGQTANRFSRYYSIGCATSITTSGQKTIKVSDKILNAFFKENFSTSKPWFVLLWRKLEKYKLWSRIEFREKLLEIKEKTKNVDYVLFVDTDSDGFYMGEVLNILTENRLSTKITIEFLLDLCEIIQKYLNDRIKKEIKEFYYNSVNPDFEIIFKQEIVAQKALIVGKKKYGLWVVNKDGVPQDKISITGIEIIKSDTPKVIRDSLEKILKIVLKTKDVEKTRNILKTQIDQTKKEILNTPSSYKDLMDYANSFNVNKLNDYDSKRTKSFEIPHKCPIHVRSVMHYNDLLKELKLTEKYPLIEEGVKVFFIPVIPKIDFLKKHGVTSLAFVENTMPEEFFKVVDVNFKQIVQRNFTDKVKILLNSTKFICCLSEESFLIQKLFN